MSWRLDQLDLAAAEERAYQREMASLRAEHAPARSAVTYEAILAALDEGRSEVAAMLRGVRAGEAYDEENGLTP